MNATSANYALEEEITQGFALSCIYYKICNHNLTEEIISKNVIKAANLFIGLHVDNHVRRGARYSNAHLDNFYL